MLMKCLFIVCFMLLGMIVWFFDVVVVEDK